MKVIKIIQKIALVIFIIGIIYLLKIYKGYEDGKKEYNYIRTYISNMQVDIEPDIEISEEYKSDAEKKDKIKKLKEPNIKVDFEGLKTINPDIKAWIWACDGSINYPVVQGTDNSYYLNHTFEKVYNSSGCIFIDYQVKDEFQTIIYGHNMKNATMFGSLLQYKDKTYGEEHPYIYIYNEEGRHKYQIFSVYMDTYENFIFYDQFLKPRQQNELIQALKELSIYTIAQTTGNCSIIKSPLQASDFMHYYTIAQTTGNCPIIKSPLQASDFMHYYNLPELESKNQENNIISLITCEYSGKDYRLVVHAKKI